eukprot:jgi/Picsp_1/4225/NSC_01734-R1_mgc80777 protein
MRMLSTKTFLFVILLAHGIGILLFVHGFLLTRIHLKDRSDLNGSICALPYKKFVWVVIDALRYDFVVEDGRYPCGVQTGSCDYKHQMPFLSSLARNRDGSSLAFRYIADAPTTTTQRLKSMTAGSLPTFFDISNAFSAAEMDEDNLIDQLVACGKKVAFMGDATWDSLYPRQFDPSLPFPCYNILDLHTVDDGINKYLLPLVKNHTAWDVIVTHYLGVDHTGHAHGVQSDNMAEKLRQMDRNMKNLVNVLAEGSYKGGPFDSTLLVVAGDHGQTLTGDHGGGSPEEVDSIFLAVDMSRYNSSSIQENLDPSLDACRLNCSCGPDKNQCVSDLSQIDAVPTLSALLDIPIPFGNLGKVSPELWSIGSLRCPQIAGDKASMDAAFSKLLKANVEQVFKYLGTYASKPGSRFPSGMLDRLRDIHDRIINDTLYQGNDANMIQQTDCMEFLSMGESFAREAWTQFREGWMFLGAMVFAVSVFIQLYVLFRIGKELSEFSHALDSAQASLVWMLNGAHAIGIFSFFFLLSEGTFSYFAYYYASWHLYSPFHNYSVYIFCFPAGKNTSYVVAFQLLALVAMQLLCPTLGIQQSTSHRHVLSYFLLGVVCCYALSDLGLQTHSGFGFWQRLTVHDQGQELGGQQHIYGYEWIQRLLDILTTSLRWDIIIFFIQYVIPSFALYTISSLFIGDKHAENRLMALGYCAIVMYHAVDLLIKENRISEAWSIIDINGDQSRNIPAWINKLLQMPLHNLLPQISMTISASLCLVSLYRSFKLGVNQNWQTYSARSMAATLCTAATQLAILISPVATPLIYVFLLFEIYAISMMPSAAQMKPLTISGCLAAIQSQSFFVTGHLCEFAGLLYTAAFVGLRDFDLLKSGFLLAFDTFGAMLISVLAAIVITSPAGGYTPPSSSRSQQVPGPLSRTKASTLRKKQNSWLEDSWPPSHPVHVVIVTIGTARASLAFCAMVSAGIQRRHLYAWALFAPKFVFEVFFVVLTDLTLLILSFLV